MAKRMSPRTFLERFFPVLKSIETKSTSSPQLARSPQDEKLRRELLRTIENNLERPLRTAFMKTGLDIHNDEDWKKLLVWLVYAIYSGKSHGRPPKWTPEKLRQLLDDVELVRGHDQKLTEGQCCELLSKGKGADGRYRGEKASTLRRVLQTAKDQRLLATGPKEVIRKIRSDQ